MRVRWKGFELPTRVLKEEESTDGRYARFVVEPFMRGYGVTIGNSLRRVLLSSLEGTAVTALRLKGADHEFTALPGIFEDVTDIVLNAKELLVQYDGDGPITMSCHKTGKGPANIPTPVAHQDFVYSASSRGGGGLVKLKVDGGAVEAEQVYFDQMLPKAIGGSVLVGDHLYGTANQALLCVEFATGKEAWTDRSVGAGSICYADGHLYLHSEKKGEVALVEATPEGYREKGRFTPPDAPDRGGSRAWAYPVVANGRLYIRDIGALWCFDIKDASAVF